jgi:hypothetical protein
MIGVAGTSPAMTVAAKSALVRRAGHFGARYFEAESFTISATAS